MEFFPSSGHMIGSKRNRPTNASKKGSSSTLAGGQRPRSGKWRLKSSRSSVGGSGGGGADDSGDGVGVGVSGGVSELDIFYFRRIAGDLQDKKLEQQIDHEIRMRDGTAKLLAASKNPNQLLEAAKSLHTSNARMLAYMSELQRRKTNEVLQREDPLDGNQVPCKAKVSLSDLRIPLLWKEGDHFKNKGDHRRYAVFCLVKIGTEIYDTALLKNIDRTCTDLTFDDVITFDHIRPDFECQLEVYCHRCQDDLSVASTPKRIRKKIEDFGNSVGRSVGKRLSGMKYDTDSTTIIGPKFDCIGSATLKLSDVDDYVGIFNLNLESESASIELPLFGNFCCRLAAQPHCLVQDTISGPMYFQDPDSLDWELYYCRLTRLSISCWKQEVSSGSPDITIPVTKSTQVSEVPASLCKHEHCIQIIGNGSRYNLAASDVETKKKWWDAIYQHLLDQVMWLQACERIMEIKTATPRRHSAYSKSMFASLYDSVDDPASPMTRVLNRLNIPECAEDEESCAENSKKPSPLAMNIEQSTSTNQTGASAIAAVTSVSPVDAKDVESSPPTSGDDNSVAEARARTVAASGVESVLSSEICPLTSSDDPVCLAPDDKDDNDNDEVRMEQVSVDIVAASPVTGREDSDVLGTSSDVAMETAKDSQKAQPSDAEPEMAVPSSDCAEQPDEQLKQNAADNSWFQMMRQNEDADSDIIMDEVEDADEVVEGHKPEGESVKKPAEESVMESLAELEVDSVHVGDESCDSLEAKGLDRTEVFSDKHEMECAEEESKDLDEGTVREEQTSTTGQTGDSSMKNSENGDPDLSNEDVGDIISKENESLKGLKSDVTSVYDEEDDISQSDGESVDQLESNVEDEEEKAESKEEARDDEDEEKANHSGSTSENDEKRECGSLSKVVEDGQNTDDKSEEIDPSDNDGRKKDKNTEDGKEDIDQSATVADDGEEISASVEMARVADEEDISQSEHVAECDTKSEDDDDDPCLGQSEENPESGRTSGERTNSEKIAEGDDNLECREKDHQSPMGAEHSEDVTQKVEGGQRLNVSREDLDQSDEPKQSDTISETVNDGLIDGCDEADSKTEDDQETGKSVEGHKLGESRECDEDVEDSSSSSSGSRTRLTRSLSKETSI